MAARANKAERVLVPFENIGQLHSALKSLEVLRRSRPMEIVLLWVSPAGDTEQAFSELRGIQSQLKEMDQEEYAMVSTSGPAEVAIMAYAEKHAFERIIFPTRAPGLGRPPTRPGYSDALTRH